MIDLKKYRELISVRHTAEDNVQVFDPVRKKWINASLEELVRQCAILYLTQERNISIKRLQSEKGIKVVRLKKRYDLTIYNKDGTVALLVECKAPNENIDSRTVEQALAYNIKLNADYFWLTNGIVHNIYELDKNSLALKKIDDLPRFL